MTRKRSRTIEDEKEEEEDVKSSNTTTETCTYDKAWILSNVARVSVATGRRRLDSFLFYIYKAMQYLKI